MAAGQSRRFGADKRQHLLADGTRLLIRTLALYQQSCSAVLLVLRAQDQQIATQLREQSAGVHLVHAADAALGMGHSLAAGASALCQLMTQQQLGYRHLFVALADMPYVQDTTLAALYHAAATNGSGHSIWQPEHAGQPGNPVLFAAEHLTNLQTLQGDQGARALLKQQPQQRLLVSVNDPGVLQDIDTQGDLAIKARPSA